MIISARIGVRNPKLIAHTAVDPNGRAPALFCRVAWFRFGDFMWERVSNRVEREAARRRLIDDLAKFRIGDESPKSAGFQMEESAHNLVPIDTWLYRVGVDGGYPCSEKPREASNAKFEVVGGGAQASPEEHGDSWNSKRVAAMPDIAKFRLAARSES